jgi:hypothetical protein
LSFIDRVFILPRLRAISEPLARRYVERSGEYLQLLETLRRGWGPAKRAAVLTAAPSRAVAGKLECDRGRLLGAARAGVSSVMASLGLNATRREDEILRLFEPMRHRLPAKSR